MRKQFVDLPDICTPSDLLDFLPVGRNAIYEMLAQRKIASVRVGKKFLIPKRALGAFLGIDGELRVSPS